MDKPICISDGCSNPAPYLPKLKRCGACHYRWQREHGKRHTATCVVCGVEYSRSRKPRGRPCCSPACRQALAQPEATLASAATATQRAAERRRERYGVAVVPYVKPRRAWNPTHTSGRVTWRSGPCRVCGKHYITWNIDVTCSPECHAIRLREVRLVHKARRRARKRDAYRADVHRKRVFEMDGYRCHLCGKKTMRAKTVPHPKAPTVDHIIPLAAGGTHEPSNCRTACFQCNAIKRHKGGGEQLILL
ncbi:HNH endonuclease [Gordonia phage Budski]|nr:HNH endonuclease [Gordonia phage Budski]